MHIPPYHKKRSWQILLVGIFIGAIISYITLVYMHGKMYEEVLSNNIQLQTKVNELKRQNQALLEDQEDLKEQSNPTILTIKIHFTNSDDLHVDKLITHQLEDILKTELQSIIGKEVDSVAENDSLLITLIENKTVTIDDLSYEFEVRKLSISDTLKLSLHIKLTD